MNERDLKAGIMRRVYLIGIMRRLLSPFMVRTYIAVILVWRLATAISIPSVLSNMLEVNVGSIARFFSYAFMETELLVKFIIVGATICLFWMMRDAISLILEKAGSMDHLGAENRNFRI